ncbi:MAG TPA: hypothetical protein VFE05_23445 [Longimicrobiaceae bacterium]|nr:hypothetical protein [Longimicrobiaceae bacterium]
MKADTFAKLLVLDTLIDAEVGFYLEHHPPAEARFREGLVSRISDLVDQVDALDAVAAARVYDAVVDFMAELPEDDDEGVVETTLRFKRTVDRITARGMERADLAQPATWAVVLDELLDVLAAEHAAGVQPDGEIRPHELARARLLLHRARDAADRMAATLPAERRAEVRDGLDRLAFAVGSRRLPPDAVQLLIAAPQRVARRYRPSTFSRIGGFVIGQLLRRRAAGGPEGQ